MVLPKTGLKPCSRSTAHFFLTKGRTYCNRHVITLNLISSKWWLIFFFTEKRRAVIKSTCFSKSHTKKKVCLSAFHEACRFCNYSSKDRWWSNHFIRNLTLDSLEKNWTKHFLSHTEIIAKISTVPSFSSQYLFIPLSSLLFPSQQSTDWKEKVNPEKGCRIPGIFKVQLFHRNWKEIKRNNIGVIGSGCFDHVICI